MASDHLPDGSAGGGSPLRVLVLAERELSRALLDALTNLTGLQLDVEAPLTNCATGTTIEPMSILLPEGDGAHWRGGHLFKWRGFDVVVLQDVWAVDDKLVPLGFELASDDLYERGNFNTRKIVLVTDPGLHIVTTGAEGETREGWRDVAARFDRSNQISFVPLVESLTDGQPVIALPLQELKAALGRDRSGGVSPPPPTAGEFARPPHGPSEALVRALRRFVQERVGEIVLVDDEPQVLDETLSFLGFAPPPLDAGAGVWVVQAKKKEAHCCQSYEELVEHCQDLVRTSFRYVLVTDILFRSSVWPEADRSRNGMDLVEVLRYRDAPGNRRSSCLAIIVFTGFSAPAIVTSAYLRGADAVVSKPGGSHGELVAPRAGRYRLLQTIAFLCFQQGYLSAKMHGQGRAAAVEDLNELRRVLPRHAASMHVQQQWSDAVWLLEGSLLYPHGQRLEEVDGIRRELLEKYAPR